MDRLVKRNMVGLALFLALTLSCAGPVEDYGPDASTSDVRDDASVLDGGDDASTPLTKEPLLIAHALGGVEGVAYSNSPEAFEHSYAKGLRWFEVDIAYTADEELVCFHWDMESRIGLSSKINETSTADFLACTFQDRFTLWTFRELLRRVSSLPDVVLVTDTKFWDDRFFELLCREIEAVDRQLFERIVPQIYRPEDLALLQDLQGRGWSFKSIIFTLYQIDISDDDLVDFVSTQGIPFVTMSTWRFNEAVAHRLRNLRIAGDRMRVLVHTVNEPDQVASFLEKGADGFYTDTYP